MPQALLEATAPAISSAPAFDTAGDENALGPRWLPSVVVLAALAVAGFVYAFFWEHSTELWWWMGHDRHTHYMFGLNLALDMRTGDVVRLLHDFDRMRVWGPVHPVLVAAIQLIAGPDHRLAVLPSLAGWILTIWCAFLIPRRLLTTGGNAAGLLAAFLIANSPAHRAFATDVMYESLGAGLSLAAIYLYLAVVQDGTRRAAVLLGLTLSVLFLHKYNYWLLVGFGIVGAEFARQPSAWFQYGLLLCQRDRLPARLMGELKHPLTYIAVAFAIAALAVVVTGGGTIAIGQWTMSVQEPHNFVHLAYIAFFARMVLWWRSTGSEWSLRLPATLRTVLMYHGSVIALWFLLPKRLSYFLWYLGPTNSDQHRDSVPFMHGLPYYLQGLQDDYLTLSWTIYLLAAMLVFGLTAWHRMKPGAAALVFFLLIAAYLTCQHPMLKNRFMHSWIAAAWVLGATGLVFAVQELAALIIPPARAFAAGGVCAVLIGLHVPAFLEPGHAQEGGLKPNEPSPLLVTRPYLPALADAKNPTILSNVSTRFLWMWTFIEEHRHQNVTAELKNFRSYEGNPELVKHWLATTRSDALVLIDIRPGSVFDWKTDEYVDLTAFKQTLESQGVWRRTERWDLPEGVTITLWKKN
jgi:Dolichyl-phosphate-mannose-protein mannosyltransferase